MSNAVTKTDGAQEPPKDEEIPVTGLALMRKPFAANHISKLPKPTKAQTDAVKADFKAGFRCPACRGWHHPDVVHLDYVGHAAITDRLLDVDPMWNWEPLSFTPEGMPMLDATGGMWIKLTVCGVTRLGYGSAAVKNTGDPGDMTKELIGDALRNAAMRFGAALELWHKGELHTEPEEMATDKQMASLQEYADSGVMTDGQIAWLKAIQGKLTKEVAAGVLTKLKEKEGK